MEFKLHLWSVYKYTQNLKFFFFFSPFEIVAYCQYRIHLDSMWDTLVWSLAQEHALEQGMETHSSILAWGIPWKEEPGGLYSPWGRKESDTTEGLTLPLYDLFINMPKTSKKFFPLRLGHCTIITSFKCMARHSAQSHCCVAIPTIHLQNFFILPNWKSAPTKQQLPIYPPLSSWQPPTPLLVSQNLTTLGTSCKGNHL